MPTLKRDDGVQFAIQTYRELLNTQKASLVKQELRLLAKNHGSYVRLFQKDKHQSEAVFSRDPGYLFGESVWEYFGRPNDLVYCELLGDSHYAAVVVVRAGSVYLDSKMPIASIPDEFTTLIAGANQYDIYIFGDVPISDKEDKGYFYFPPEFTKSFNRLDRGAIDELPTTEALQLQPLEMALRSEQLGKKMPIGMLLLIAVVILGVGWWVFTPKIETVVQKPVEQTNPWQLLENTLSSPKPIENLAAFNTVFTLVNSVSGWEPVSIKATGNSYLIKMNTLGGGVKELQTWAAKHNVTVNLTQQGVDLNYVLPLTDRSKTIFMNLQDALADVIDNMNKVLPTKSVALQASTKSGLTQEMKATVTYTNISPDILTLIGRAMTNLPVRVDNIETTISNGALSGNIQLTVVGK